MKHGTDAGMKHGTEVADVAEAGDETWKRCGKWARGGK